MLTLDDIIRLGYDPQTCTHPDFSPIFDFLSGRVPSASSSLYTGSLESLTIMNLNPGQESFRYCLQNLRVELTLLAIKVLSTREGSGVHWRWFDADDSEDLVDAFWSGQWDVPGAIIV